MAADVAVFIEASTPVNVSRHVLLLQRLDARAWHNVHVFSLSLDFAVQFLVLSFSPQVGHVIGHHGAATAARCVSSVLLVAYAVDIVLRTGALRAALLSSRSTMAFLLCVVAMTALVVLRFQFRQYEFDLTLAYACLVAACLLLKPHARRFSRQLYTCQTDSAIRISIASLRASLARIPGISALAVERMENELVVICGRDDGDMSPDELVRFLALALQFRPPQLAATEFLAHLRALDARSSGVTYGVMEVVKSTMVHWSNQGVALVLCLLVALLNAAIGPLMAYFLSRLSDAFETMTGPRDTVPFHVGLIGTLGLIVPFVLGNYAVGHLQAKMIATATKHIQTNLLATILRQDNAFFAARSEGDLINVFSSDVARVYSLWITVFWSLVNPLIAVCVGFGYALFMKYAIGVMAFAFTAIFLSSGPQGTASVKSKAFASTNAYVTAEFQNAVACQKVVRAYRIHTSLLARFTHHCARLETAQFLKDLWANMVQIYIESAMYVFTTIVTAALALKVWNSASYPTDAVSMGEFFGLLTLLQRVTTPVTKLGAFMRVAIGNASSLQRVDDILVGLGTPNTTPDDNADLPNLPTMKTDLRLERLGFQYDKESDHRVLNDLSITVPRGSYTCIVGPSGCGKSTLLACLMQFEEPDSGAIRVDGHDIYNFSKASFMRQLAVVFQDGGILNGTILDNIRYGNTDATDAECVEAARLAECEFIGDLADGYETVVGQHATTRLSGGQAQRLCLARALCRKPSLLLLDEATSALDPMTEASIVATLERLVKTTDMTIISVTHRLATTVHADQIVVLDGGRVAEHGRHEELVAAHGLFYEMAHSSDETTAPAETKANDNSDMALAREFTRSLSTHVRRDSELSNGSMLSSSSSFRTDRKDRRSVRHVVL